MKNIFVVCFVFMLPLHLFSQKEEQYKTLKDETHGISIKYPEDWEKQSNPKAVFVFKSPAEDNKAVFRENINMVVARPGQKVSLDKIMEVTHRQMSKTNRLNGYKRVKHQKVKLGKSRFAKTIYKHYKHGVNYKVALYQYPYGKKVYNITCTATESTFDDYMLVFERMIRSFSVNQ